MARVHRVGKSRKEYTCSHGEHTIPVGSPYLWAKPGFRRRTPIIRCVAHPFRASDLTTGVRAEALVAIEAFEDAVDGIDTFDALESAWTDLQSELENFVQTRQDALDAWENGNSQLEDLLYQAEAARDEVDAHQIEVITEDHLGDEEIEARMEDDDCTRDEAVEMMLQEALDEAVQEAEGIVGGLDV